MNNYICEYTTEFNKYSGPYAIVSWSGSKDTEGRMQGSGFIQYAGGMTY